MQVQVPQLNQSLEESSLEDHCMDGCMPPKEDSENKEEANLSATFNETECSFSTMRSTLLIRDTTDEEGGAGVETSQITVNTHTSILNIADDDDEEDGSIIKDDDCSEIPIERSYIFDEGDSTNDIDFQSVVSEDRQGSQSSSTMCMPQTPEPYQATCDVSTYLGERRESNTEVAVKGGGLFDLVDNLCFRGATPIKDEREAVVVWDQYKQMLEYDILELLGCTNAPDAEEISKVWQNTLIPNPVGNQATSLDIPHPPRARRRPWQERAVRVHRIRTDRLDGKDATVGSVEALKQSRSMDDRMWNVKKHQKHDSWASFQLFDSTEPLKPTVVPPKIEEDGYDSDPEEHAVSLIPPLSLKSSSSNSSSVQRKILQPRTENCESIPSSTNSSVVEVVQETLNMSWSVTWHPGKSENFNEPRNVSIWIERGTLIECNTIMLEPNLMWRETFQPDLKTKRKLNESSQKPHSIRLLNLCRVLNESGLDRSRFPLVRPSHAFIVKTSDSQEFLFEAKNQTERDDLVRRWKLTTARFATLAVLEDIETICKEFFSPTVTSRMLVPDYDKPEESLASKSVIEDQQP